MTAEHDAQPSVEDGYTTVRRRYISGLFIQGVGGGLTSLTSSYLIFHQTGRVALVALIVVMTNVPQLLLAPVANRLAHRLGGPKLYVLCWTITYSLNLILFVLGLTGHLTTFTLLAWYLVQGATMGIGTPSAGLVRTEISPRGDSSGFNASATRAITSATMLGMVIGGAALAVVSPAWIYLAAGLSGIPVVLAVLPVTRTSVADRTTRHPRLSEARAAQRSNREVRAAFRFAVVIFVLSGYTVTLPSIASRIGERPIILSSLQAAGVFGGLFVVIGVRLIHRRSTWLAVQRVCVAVIAVSILYLGWVALRDHQPIWYLATAVLAIIPLGFALNLDTAILNGAIQVAAPVEARGPVLTAFALVPVAAVPLSQVIIGNLADLVSLPFTLMVVGGLTVVLVLIPHRTAARAAFTALDDEHIFPESGLTHTLEIGAIEAAGVTIADQILGPEITSIEEREV